MDVGGARVVRITPMLPAMKPGDPAPDADLTAHDGTTVRLSTLWAARPLLIVFYPGDDTAVCTKQLCEYRDRWPDFTAAGVAVVGINSASRERHQRFAGRHGFPFPLLADPGQACAQRYGAKAWYGTRRLTVLVDRSGTVRWVKAVNPFSRPRADELLAAARAAT
jgi:peroxiredoxin Q/BCP